jgi:ABC-type oligopeptide transport system ATPase subunit
MESAPTSALDVSVQAELLNLLKDLQQQLNLTLLFVSHDLAVVRQMCDRVIVMKDGEALEQGDNDAIFEQPQHPYTQQLLSTMPVLPNGSDSQALLKAQQFLGFLCSTEFKAQVLVCALRRWLG